MARVPKPRDIIDRKALAGDLALSGGGAAARPGRSSFSRRP